MKTLLALGGLAALLLAARQARANTPEAFYPAENWILDTMGKRKTISLAGLDLIKRSEGLALKPYKDAAGFWTIGYGHKLQSGEWWEAIKQAEADALLARDVADAEDAVNSQVTAPITQAQFDALASFTYNLGPGALKRSTLLAKVNAGDATAAAEFGRWVFADGKLLAGLQTRRAAEARLFVEGVA